MSVNVYYEDMDGKEILYKEGEFKEEVVDKEKNNG